MKKIAVGFLSMLVIVGGVVDSPQAAESNRSWQANLLTRIAKLSNEDIAVVYATLALQEVLVNGAGYPEESLEKYDLENPDVVSVETNLERKYVLVAFPSIDQAKTNTAFAIFQQCDSGLLLISERGFYLYHKKLIDSFNTRSKDSATDYFERDGCRALVGEE